LFYIFLMEKFVNLDDLISFLFDSISSKGISSGQYITNLVEGRYNNKEKNEFMQKLFDYGFSNYDAGNVLDVVMPYIKNILEYHIKKEDMNGPTFERNAVSFLVDKEKRKEIEKQLKKELSGGYDLYLETLAERARYNRNI